MPTKKSIPIDPHDLDMVAYHSASLANHKQAIYDIDELMQKNYSTMLSGLVPHLDPVIVVQSDGRGGTYTLIHDGESETIAPVAEIFQLVKSVAHSPLGIYVILAPYLKNQSQRDWIEPLLEFKTTLKKGLANIKKVGLPKKATQSSNKILEGSIKFIDKTVAAKKFSIESFETYTRTVANDIFTNMQFAAQAQVDGVEALLKRWKKELGAKKWSDVYAIVLAIWTTEYKNQNWLILNRMMDQSRVDDHLITIGIASFDEDTVPIALDNLARIVQDNVAAAMIFPTDSVLADALKGPEDLLSTAIEGILGCPHHSGLKEAKLSSKQK